MAPTIKVQVAPNNRSSKKLIHPLPHLFPIAALIRVSGKSANYFVAGRYLSLPIVIATLGSQSLDSNAALGNLDLGYNYHWWDGAVLPIGLGLSLVLNSIFCESPSGPCLPRSRTPSPLLPSPHVALPDSTLCNPPPNLLVSSTLHSTLCTPACPLLRSTPRHSALLSSRSIFSLLISALPLQSPSPSTTFSCSLCPI